MKIKSLTMMPDSGGFGPLSNERNVRAKGSYGSAEFALRDHGVEVVLMSPKTNLRAPALVRAFLIPYAAVAYIEYDVDAVKPEASNAPAKQ